MKRIIAIELPERFDSEELRQAFAAVNSEAVLVEVAGGVNLSEGESVRRIPPSAIVEVPEGFDPRSLDSVVSTHHPELSDDERREQEAEEEVLLSPQSLLARIEALEEPTEAGALQKIQELEAELEEQKRKIAEMQAERDEVMTRLQDLEQSKPGDSDHGAVKGG